MSKTKKIEIIAGDIGDELFRQGLPNDRNMLSAGALVNPMYRGLVVRAHEEFLKAGATYLITNNHFVTPGVGFTTDEVVEFTREAGKLAVQARRHAGKEDTVVICGSLPPLMPSFRSDRMMKEDEALPWYSLIGEALEPYVDVLIAETMSSLDEAKVAFKAAEPIGKPIMVAFALNDSGGLRSGKDTVEAVQELLEFCCSGSRADTEGAGVLRGILFNCSQPEQITRTLQRLTDCEDLMLELNTKQIRLGAYSDRVSPKSRAGMLESKLSSEALHDVVDIEVFSAFAQRWIALGAELVGGCCGVSPDYIGHMVERIEQPEEP